MDLVSDPTVGTNGNAEAKCPCGVLRPDRPRRKTARATNRWVTIGALGLLAVLLVGWEVVERHLFPDLGTGARHAILTAQAGVVTLFSCGLIYFLMRRQRQTLTETAVQLTRVLESYPRWSRWPEMRFQNPHLVHCWEVLNCDKLDCPMHRATDERCWQIMALGRSDGDHQPPRVRIEQCHECEVYRTSCPDVLTELGESFNNLLFLLDEESQRVGRMRAQMIEKEKMVAIGRMASGIAHEIGNPLSSLSSIVQMLKRTETGAGMSDRLDLMETHIQRISTIVRKLGSLARPSTQRWERMDVGELLEEAVRLISFDRRARGVKIELEAPKPMRPTYALHGELQQVFINLMLNALDAMPSGGRLRVRGEATPRWIVVRIADTGCGIPAETGRRVFEPFFTTKEPGQGTGLGLAVSYGIVQKHGGRLDFSSDAGGTEFTVEIPILDIMPGKSDGTGNHFAG